MKNAEEIAEIIPKVDIEFHTGFCEAEKSVSAISAVVAARRAADFSSRDLTSDVVFRTVCMQRYVGTIQNFQKFRFVGAQARQQAIQSDKTCFS